MSDGRYLDDYERGFSDGKDELMDKLEEEHEARCLSIRHATELQAELAALNQQLLNWKDIAITAAYECERQHDENVSLIAANVRLAGTWRWWVRDHVPDPRDTSFTTDLLTVNS